jgi:hypothetical protein
MIFLSKFTSNQTTLLLGQYLKMYVTALPVDPEHTNETDDVFLCNTEENNFTVALEEFQVRSICTSRGCIN